MELFDSVVRNAIDFLKKSIDEIEDSPKYSVINFCSAIELFLKARLLTEHWSLIVAKPESANLSRFRAGDFVSVSAEEAIQRLRNIADIVISREEESAFKEVRDHRNKLVHFFHPKYVDSRSAPTLQDVVAQQCKAWFYLHRLLVERWGQYFSGYRDDIRELDDLMHQNRQFLRAKFEALGPEIDQDKQAGVEYVSCFFCGFESAKVEEASDPLFSHLCAVCKAVGMFLRVPCPECGDPIIVEDMGKGQCNRCGFETNVSFLLSKYEPFVGLKDEPQTAYCANCEYADQASVIPWGDGYLCLNCLCLHDWIDRCEWCTTPVAGMDMVDSYLKGCILCEGHDGWDKD